MNISRNYVWSLYTKNNHYFETPFVRIVYHGMEVYLWDNIPEEYKKLNNLDSFKESIKKWVPLDFTYRFYKTHVHDAGFLER